MTIEEKLKSMHLELPPLPSQKGKLAPAVRSGNLVFTSGNVSPQKGKVGKDLNVEQGYAAAKQCLVNVLGNLRAAGVDLNKVRRVVKLLGFVNCADGFTDTPGVIHGATDTLIALYGEEAGWHARSAIGVYQLPGNAAVEIELIVEVSD